MNSVKKHFIFDMILVVVILFVIIVMYNRGDGFELLGVITFAPIVFVMHMMIVLITGLVKWNKALLQYSLLGLILCALVLLRVYTLLNETPMKIGG